MKSRLLIIISISLVIIASWIFLIVPELKNSVSDFEIINQRIGSDRIVTEIGEDLPEPVRTVDRWKQEVISREGNNLEIHSIITTFDILTTEIIFESESVFYVDRKTRTHIEDHEKFFMFPNNVQKKTYEFIHPLIYFPTKFVFEEENKIDNITVYVFSCNPIGDDISYAYDQFSQKILSDSTCRVWVEPITGLELSFEKTWHDYYLEQDQIFSVDKGSSETSEFAKDLFVNIANDRIKLFYLYDIVVPIILVAAFLSSVTVVFVNQNLRTRTEELEQEKKDKFEILGLMAANLAHELKNPLASMTQSLEIINRKPKDVEMVLNESKRATRVIKRITHQVDEVLNYVQAAPLASKYTTVLTILKQSLDFLDIPDNISIEIPEKDLEVKWDTTQISIVFTNIILNAIHAIGKDDGSISIIISEENETVIIVIENTGTDIPEKDLEKIFELLYTTKMEGTGLGLAGCKNITQSHNGTITATNNPVKFTITLPKTV